MVEWAESHWIIGVISFQKIYGLCGLKLEMAMRQFLAMRIIRIASASRYMRLFALYAMRITDMKSKLPHTHGHP